MRGRESSRLTITVVGRWVRVYRCGMDCHLPGHDDDAAVGMAGGRSDNIAHRKVRLRVGIARVRFQSRSLLEVWIGQCGRLTQSLIELTEC